MRSGSSHSLGILSQAILCLILDAVSYYPRGLVTGGSSSTDMLVMESTPLLLSPMMAGEEVRTQLMLRLEQSQQRWMRSENATFNGEDDFEGGDGRHAGHSHHLVVPRLSFIDEDEDSSSEDGAESLGLPADGVLGVELEDDDDDSDDDEDSQQHNITWASYPRRKRSVMGLYHMLQCTSSCNPLGYKGYGCYCGFLGSGTAVDGIDTCCLEHDQCYEVASTCEKKFSYYTVPYKWKCKGNPVCLPGRTERSAKGSCSHQLCECDRRFAECIAHYPCPSNRAICISSAWRRWHNFAFGRNIRQFFRH